MAVPGAEQRAEIAAAIGDAAVGARRWEEVTAALRDAFRVDMASIEIVDVVTGAVRASTDALPEAAHREYEQHIFHINPRLQVPDPVPLRVYADRHYAEHAPTAPEYYDWCARNGVCRYSVGGAVIMDSDFFAVGALLAHADRGPPDEATEAAWEAMLPVIANALRVEQALARRGAATDLAEVAGFESSRAYALLGGDGRIVQATSAFERIVSAHPGLRLRRGELGAVNGSERPALQRLLCSAVAPCLGLPTPVRIASPLGGQGLLLRAVPLDRGRDIFARLRPAALLVLVDLDAPARASVADLQAVWQLSPREAELALALGQGRSLAQAAHLLGIGEGTARHHLKSIFRRMDIDRQSDLVRLVTKLG